MKHPSTFLHRSLSNSSYESGDEPKSLPSFFKLPIAPALFDASLRSTSSPATVFTQDKSASPSSEMSPERQQAFGERFHPYEKQAPYIKPKVKCIHSVSGIREVTCDLVAELVSEPSKLHEVGFDRLLIVDCRYGYEYEGGHILSAVNAPHPTSIRSAVFDSLQPAELTDRTIVIMHCELSRHRGPRGLKLLRKIDRELIGPERFPELHLPQIFLMTGGYREFYSKHPHLCTPNSYVPMDDPVYGEQLREVRRQHRLLAQPKLPPSRASRSSTSLQPALAFAPIGTLSRARSAISANDLFQVRLLDSFEPISTGSSALTTPSISPQSMSPPAYD